MTIGAEATAQKIKLRGKLSPMDIKVFEPMRQDHNMTSACLKNNGGCSHLCLAADNAQKFSCACPRGIRLIDDKNCAKNCDEILVVALRTGIRTISLDTPDFSDIEVPMAKIFPDLEIEQEAEDELSIVAVDFDPVNGSIYWTDQTRGINRINPDGTENYPLVTSQVFNPDGIAVDYFGRNLFWTDTITDRIEVTKLDGSHRKILLSHDLDEPRDLSLDLKRGYIYWSDWGQRPRIERAWMDGTHRETIITEDIGWPNGIALDVEDEKIYWCDAKTDKIEVANVDGSDRKVIIDEYVPHPFGLTILGEYIYWTDWQESVIERANKITGKDRVILVSHLENRLMSLKASQTALKSADANGCAFENGGCSHLCLFTPEGAKCACPNGFELSGQDQKFCVQPEAFLLYVSQGDIYRSSIKALNNNGPSVIVNGVTSAAAIDGDFNERRMYWTDVEEKTISRSFINGTGSEILVEFGLESPENIAIDWMSKNMYWTDSSLSRIEVSRMDGSSRRVLIWDVLNTPMSIAVDPGFGHMYWSSWGQVPVIETADLDGQKRRVFVPDVGKANGLTIDFNTRRLYWTDLDKSQIAYSPLDVQGYVKTVLKTKSQLYTLTLFKDHIYWTDWTSKVIEKADKENGLDRSIIVSNVDKAMDLMVFQDFNVSKDSYENISEDITNPCLIDNGGCSDLCLYNGKEAKCTCASHHYPDAHGVCQGPQSFLIFGQKNKISRLIDDEQDVPDLVLPIQGARDIRSLSYDTHRKIIYWIDYGSKKHNRVSISRAFDNGTIEKKMKLLSYNEDPDSDVIFEPHDIAIDSFHRLLFWNDEATNVINILTLDDTNDEYYTVGHILPSKYDKPRSMALHSKKSLIFWVNIGSPVRIERALMNGDERQTVIQDDISVPTDICVDQASDFLFWVDIHLERLERSNLNGKNRRILVKNGISGPLTLITVHQDYVYWAVRSSETIYRANKLTGNDQEVVKSKVLHLSSLISVNTHHLDPNPCKGKQLSIYRGGTLF